MVDIKDVFFIKIDSEYSLQNIRNTMNIQNLKQMEMLNNNIQPRNSIVNVFDDYCYALALYKGSIVFVKRICKKTIDLTRNIRKELIQMREMRHENINLFSGAIIDASNIAIMFLYCARGNLEDVLQNKDIHMDNMFVASLVADLIKGMIYLHDSDIVSHGNLKPTNCLIDSRWVLQITDYGLHEFKSNQDRFKSKENQEKDMLWRAPELLKNPDKSKRGTQKGDVYSFALILYEIILQRNPFEDSSLSNREILHRIINPKIYDEIFRPSLNKLKCPAYISRCVRDELNEICITIKTNQ
ncbi:hypothetical protein NH340_JMT01876 [Sarcoptes scabiei]|nr:hypothetical protein NH340_JMT01876 [Sarcoptes scabiei]